MSNQLKYCKNGHLRTIETAIYDKNGKYKDCRSCSRLRAKEWYKNNPVKVKNYAAAAYLKNKDSHIEKCRTRELKKKYGLTRKQYISLFEVQNYQCANLGCKKLIEFSTGHIDHNHETGQVRGILCKKCNWALGQLDDNPIKIRGLADYLIKNVLAK